MLQNKFLRASQLCFNRSPTNLSYSNAKVLKLQDMINMEFAKFMFKYNNQMLPNSFDFYFINT